MEDIVRVGLLLDFYGQLLTKKQYRIMESYFIENLSLAEIAEEEGISRQAVHDLLHRSIKVLEQFEEKLLLLSTYWQNKKNLEEIKIDLNNILEECSEPVKNKILLLKGKIEQLILD